MEGDPTDATGGRGGTGGVGLYELAVPLVAGLIALVVSLILYEVVVRPTGGAIHTAGTAAVLLVPVGVAVWARRAVA